ncbi:MULTISPECIES: M23 family metallopeptidase [unclassified Sphingomonas]|uniref:M23 family metallopeptidase n=1 Tax=unclassified Sphingomonas TaxID=196159 RepID=UPI0021519A1A|nr:MULTISPECIES: M23 family metallopeptidase [unclassified Sphingomonas]MCR5870251.1 M23 family metallopeptidase [Sphingomonas sp. J344]UUX98060.1 M23 family metallopeptidase [Sphingomonas sp. J315]
MFLRNDHGLEQSGGAAALSFGRGVDSRKPGLAERFRERYPDFELIPDLGSRIGSREWFRGAATCGGLCAFVFLLSPGFERPIYGGVPSAHAASADLMRAQSIAPLDKGGVTGTRLAANRLVTTLTDTPERPIIQHSVTLGSGSGLQAALARSGVGKGEAAQAADLIAGAMALGDLKSGTQLDLTLGRRVDKSAPRPLEKLAFRARFDLSLELVRTPTGLALNEIPIAVDHTPLRIRGRVGESLYRSARAAGAPARAVEAYIRSIATRMPIGRVGSDAEFDIIVEQARAATGEVQMGNLLFAGLSGGGSGKLQLVRWEEDGKVSWYDGAGKGERKGQMAMPAAGRISSGFGLRRHPVLRFTRMHKGLDIAAGYGAPIRAANDGVVAFAGRNGGYGNFVRLNHSGGMGTGYGHMSRIAVRGGQRVSRGQVIGYVGSTGISTGPHLHYELYRNGVAINPRSVSFSVVQQLGGNDLRAFKSKLAQLLAVPVGGTRGKPADTADAE